MGNSKAKKLWKKQCHEERKKNYSNGLWCDPYDWVWYGYISKDKLEKIIGVEPKPSQQQPSAEEVEVAQLSSVAEEGSEVKLEPSATTSDAAEKSARGCANATQQQQQQPLLKQEDERCPVGKIIDFDP